LNSRLKSAIKNQKLSSSDTSTVLSDINSYLKNGLISHKDGLEYLSCFEVKDEETITMISSLISIYKK